MTQTAQCRTAAWIGKRSGGGSRGDILGTINTLMRVIPVVCVTKMRVNIVKNTTCLEKMLYILKSETTCFGLYWPSSVFHYTLRTV